MEVILDLDELTVAQKPKQIVVRPEGRSYKASEDENWVWKNLQDYLAQKIFEQHGAFPRDSLKESSICKGFLNRWPNGMAAKIARWAFEVENGWWMNAPITFSRFTASNDKYFAEEIAKKIEIGQCLT